MRRLLPTSLLLLALAAPACKRSAPAAAPDAGVPAAAPGPQAALLLEGLEGEVQVEAADGGARAGAGPLRNGDALRDGDMLRTGPGAGATLRLPDGRQVEVGPGARLRVRAGEGRVELEVLEGVILSRTPAAGESALQLGVRTPQGLARVAAGTELQVAVAAGETRVEVRLGEVELLGAAGERTRAGAGQVLRVTAGRVEVVARERRVLELAPLQVTVRAEGAGVQLRRQGAAAWRTLGLGDAQALQAGDGVRTAGAPARLALQGSDSTLQLRGRTELTFLGAGQGAGASADEGAPLDEARVELRRGSLGLQVAPGRRGRLVLPELTVESDEAGGGLSFERSAEGLTVEARTGGATLVRGEARQPLRAGERARVPRAGPGPLAIESVPRAAVQLRAPPGAAGPLQLFHPGLPEVTLAWDAPMPPGGAQVEVASDAAFLRPVLSGHVDAPFVNVPAPARGQLHWRVTGPDGQRLAQGSAQLAPEPLRRPLARLRNEVPEGTERTTIFYQDRPPAVTFTWEPSAGAARYQVAVYRDGSLEHPVAERLVTEPHAALEAGMLDEGRFLWSVAPLSATGTPLRGGRMNKLELVYDNSVPGLVLGAPRNGARAGRGPLWVEGVAPVGSALSVNGEPLSLDAKGRFHARVRPTGQPPLLLFMMTRPDAPAVLTVRRLR